MPSKEHLFLFFLGGNEVRRNRADTRFGGLLFCGTFSCVHDGREWCMNDNETAQRFSRHSLLRAAVCELKQAVVVLQTDDDAQTAADGDNSTMPAFIASSSDWFW